MHSKDVPVLDNPETAVGQMHMACENHHWGGARWCTKTTEGRAIARENHHGMDA